MHEFLQVSRKGCKMHVYFFEEDLGAWVACIYYLWNADNILNIQVDTVPTLQISQLNKSYTGLATKKTFWEVILHWVTCTNIWCSLAVRRGMTLPREQRMEIAQQDCQQGGVHCLRCIVRNDKFLAGNAISYLYALFICSFPIAASEITVWI